ncbi:MAG TPA: SdpI family protein [Flavobacterium sp.]|nr:SdpI family protein [Flavobacterium sp.]
MEWTNHFFQLPGLCGIIFTIGGIITLLFPPKKINALYGYRTAASMKSIERWKFAQKYSSVRLLLSGIVLGLVSATHLWLNIGHKTELFSGITLTLLAVFYVLSTTEKALKAKFPNQ